MVEAYFEYEIISRFFSGWSLSDLKDMSVRERNYWIEVIDWNRHQKNG